jgi:hypothetical protein
MQTAPRRSFLRLFPVLAVLFAACGQDAAPPPAAPIADGWAFVTVPDETGADGSYLAIRKDALERESLQVRGDKLLVLAPSSSRGSSALADPPEVLATYPLVDLAAFKARPGSELYILVAPFGR